jgi:hypothetical protein
MDDGIKTYLARWQAVSEIERQEQQIATVAARWQQLNSIIGMAIGLGLHRSDEDETEVFRRWAKLKDTASPDPTG